MTDELTAIRQRWAEYNDGRPHMLDWYLDRDGKLAQDVGTLLALVDQQQAIIDSLQDTEAPVIRQPIAAHTIKARITSISRGQPSDLLTKEMDELATTQAIIDAAHKVVNAIYDQRVDRWGRDVIYVRFGVREEHAFDRESRTPMAMALFALIDALKGQGDD